MRGRRHQRVPRALLALCFAYGSGAACMSLGGNGLPRANDPAAAAVFAATNVAASVVNRKVTDDCYAACTPGSACNHETGLCERIACSCPADQICERIGTELVCRQPTPRREGAFDAAADGSDASARGDEPGSIGPPRSP
jgi:hypothetical protein